MSLCLLTFVTIDVLLTVGYCFSHSFSANLHILSLTFGPDVETLSTILFPVLLINTSKVLSLPPQDHFPFCIEPAIPIQNGELNRENLRL